MSKCCLSMIVRQEEHVIERCLDSVKPLIEHWIIVDTGSTDSTMDKVRVSLDGIPGQLIRTPWPDDFAAARNVALEPCKPMGLPVLVMDADDEFHCGPDFDIESMTGECYGITDIHKGNMNIRPHIFRPNVGTHWVGVRHEYVDGIAPPEVIAPSRAWVEVRHEGSRSQNPQRFLDDATALWKSVARPFPRQDPNHVSWTFFQIAQSYWDAGKQELAMDWYENYLKRELPKETDHMQWIAALRIALGLQQKHSPFIEVTNAYSRTISIDKERIEPYILLGQYLMNKGDYAGSMEVMDEAMALEFKPKMGFQDLRFWNEREAIYQHMKGIVEIMKR